MLLHGAVFIAKHIYMWLVCGYIRLVWLGVAVSSYFWLLRVPNVYIIATCVRLCTFPSQTQCRCGYLRAAAVRGNTIPLQFRDFFIILVFFSNFDAKLLAKYKSSEIVYIKIKERVQSSELL